MFTIADVLTGTSYSFGDEISTIYFSWAQIGFLRYG